MLKIDFSCSSFSWGSKTESKLANASIFWREVPDCLCPSTAFVVTQISKNAKNHKTKNVFVTCRPSTILRAERAWKQRGQRAWSRERKWAASQWPSKEKGWAFPLMSILVREAPRAPHGELVPRSLRGTKDWGLTPPKRLCSLRARPLQSGCKLCHTQGKEGFL